MNAGQGLTRRGLLFGVATARASQMPSFRPPWADDAAHFTSACTRCDACVVACPEDVLRRDETGYPVFDPRLGECVFCGECVDACAPAALRRDGGLPWRLRASIATPQCLNTQGIVCASCADACPERALRRAPQAGGSQILVDASACTGCGACVAVCPTEAVTLFEPKPEFA